MEERGRRKTSRMATGERRKESKRTRERQSLERRTETDGGRLEENREQEEFGRCQGESSSTREVDCSGERTVGVRSKAAGITTGKRSQHPGRKQRRDGRKIRNS